jgi:hypothetical protein
VQSAPLLQKLPALHVGQEPPQSTSDSEPFVAPSLHVAAEQIDAVLQ